MTAFMSRQFLTQTTFDSAAPTGAAVVAHQFERDGQYELAIAREGEVVVKVPVAVGSAPPAGEGSAAGPQAAFAAPRPALSVDLSTLARRQHPARAAHARSRRVGSQPLPGYHVLLRRPEAPEEDADVFDSRRLGPRPGLGAGTVVENTFGASSSDAPTQAALTCKINDPSRDAKVTDGPYGPGPFCTSKATVTSRGGSDLDAHKWVTGDPKLGFYNTATDSYVTPGDIACPLLTFQGAQYTRYPCIALVLAGQNFRFLLNVVNVGNTPATEVRLVDGLPHLGDTGVKLTDQQRETQWDPRPLLTSAPTLLGPGIAQFAYTTQPQACTAELTTPPGSCPGGNWNPDFSPDAQGFRAFVTFPDQLAPGKSFAITVPMSAPVTLNTPPNNLPVAWNSFAHTDFVLEPGATTPNQFPLVEPPKVGVALPFGTLEVDKRLTGPQAGSAVGPFRVSYDCTVTPAGGTPQSVAKAQGTFDVRDPLIVPHVPVGATCSVWETDTRGGLSEHTTPATAIKTQIQRQQAGNTTVLLTNDFPQSPPPPPPGRSPARGADLTVTKHVNHASTRVGDPLTYTIRVNNAGPATATNVRVSDSPSRLLTLLRVRPSQGRCRAGRPLSCTLGSLAPRAKATITITATGRAPGLLRNTATVTANEHDPTPANNSAQAVTRVRLAPARLRIAKTPTFTRVRARDTVRYRIRVQALGAAAAIHVRVCDRLDRSVTVTSAPHAHISPGQACWTLPRLDARHPRVFTVRIRVNNVSRATHARDTASAGAVNAHTVRARATLAITPKPTPPGFTG